MTRHLGRTHLLSTGFGLMMASAAGIHTAGAAAVIAIAASVMVVVGIRFRPAGTIAVLLSAAAVLLNDAHPVAAGLAGLTAACYLVLRHNESGLAGLVGASSTALVAALGFSFAGVLAAASPFELPWLPLLAPPTVFAVYMLATWPFYFANEVVATVE